MFKKILISSGLALTLFLITIFLFGDQNQIQIATPYLIAQQNAAPKNPAPAPVNLTKYFSNRLTSAILDANPNGPQTVDGQLAVTVSNPKAFVQQALAKEVGTFDPLDLEPIIDTSKFVTIKTTTASIIDYFKNFSTLFDAKLFAAPDDPSVDMRTYFADILTQLDTNYNQLLTLSVPSELTDIHLQALMILGRERNIISLVKNSDTDPLQALLALQTATNFHDDMLTLQNSISAYREMKQP